MSRRLVYICVASAMLGLALLGGAPGTAALAAQAQESATFTVTVRSIYLRDTPSLESVRTYSVFKGQQYPVLARTPDAVWLRLNLAGASNGTWIPASAGTLSGSLDVVPAAQVAAAAPTPAAAPIATAAPNEAAPAPAGEAVGTSGPVPMTINSNRTYVWDAPGWRGHRISVLSRRQVVTAAARDPRGAWVQVYFSGAGWIPTTAGRLSTAVMNLPVSDELMEPTPTPVVEVLAPPGPMPPWIPVLSDRARRLYQRADRAGRSPYMFSVVGDCNSETPLYLDLLRKNMVLNPDHAYLEPTARRFRYAFYRDSLGVNGGFNTASVFDPLWANPSECRRGESPFACELRVSMASVVFIMLGTGDTFTWQNVEANYRRMIEYALRSGTVPVLVTKADALEWTQGGAPVNHINDTIRRLAQEYQVPLMDFDWATRDMVNHGLNDEGDSDFHTSDTANLLHALMTLQTLYVITH